MIIAVDGPAASGKGTLARRLAMHFGFAYLDTGKIYRVLGLYKLSNPKKFNYSFIRKKIKNLKMKDLQKKILLTNEIGIAASVIAKNKKVRKLVHNFQVRCAYYPPKKYNGSCLDGRDITYKIIPNAEFKFFITASTKTRAKRRFLELRKLNHKIKFEEVLKSIKKRDKNDYNRKISPLKKTKDSILINTTNLSKRACFLKIKKIIDKKLKIDGNL